MLAPMPYWGRGLARLRRGERRMFLGLSDSLSDDSPKYQASVADGDESGGPIHPEYPPPDSNQPEGSQQGEHHRGGEDLPKEADGEGEQGSLQTLEGGDVSIEDDVGVEQEGGDPQVASARLDHGEIAGEGRHELAGEEKDGDGPEPHEHGAIA